MGNRGKVEEQARARDLRAEGWTMPEIAEKLGVSRSSVSAWTRDVPYTPRRPPRSGYRKRGPNALQRRKQEEIESLLAEGRERIGALSEREFLIAGTALYAGEGFKSRFAGMANTNPSILLFFSLIAPCPIRRSAARSTRWAVRESHTRARTRIVP